MVVALDRWPLDYFIKAHASPDELYVQVGDQAEQAYWGPPETMATPRTPYRSVSRQAEHGAAVLSDEETRPHLECGRRGGLFSDADVACRRCSPRGRVCA